MISKHGAPLIAEEARQAFSTKLLPYTYLVTPNLHEAAALAGAAVENVPAMEDAARKIAEQGAQAVLVKGGHLREDAVDVLYDGSRFEHFRTRRIETSHTHGTGCTYSAAITAELAKGRSLPEAVAAAKKYITEAIATAPGLGHGCGPVNHHAGTS